MRDELDVVSVDDQLVLLLGGDGGGHSVGQRHTADDLLAKEVADLKGSLGSSRSAHLPQPACSSPAVRC